MPRPGHGGTQLRQGKVAAPEIDAPEIEGAAERAEVSEEVVTRLFYGLLGKNPEQRQDERDERDRSRPQHQHSVGTERESKPRAKGGVGGRTKQLGGQQANQPRDDATQGAANKCECQSSPGTLAPCSFPSSMTPVKHPASSIKARQDQVPRKPGIRDWPHSPDPELPETRLSPPGASSHQITPRTTPAAAGRTSQRTSFETAGMERPEPVRQQQGRARLARSYTSH